METEKFGTYLRRLRLSKGMTQIELSKAVGVHPSQISSWENAFRSPSARSLSRLSEALGSDLRKWFLTSRDNEIQTVSEITNSRVSVTLTFNDMSEDAIREFLRSAGVAA